jgi:polyhydroxyalkanoate synthesis regulator protein
MLRHWRSLRLDSMAVGLSGKQGITVATQILIKRYARSRLYDVVEGRYVSVDELRQRQRDGLTFIVRDAETGVDITHALLA